MYKNSGFNHNVFNHLKETLDKLDNGEIPYQRTIPKKSEFQNITLNIENIEDINSKLFAEDLKESICVYHNLFEEDNIDNNNIEEIEKAIRNLKLYSRYGINYPISLEDLEYMAFNGMMQIIGVSPFRRGNAITAFLLSLHILYKLTNCYNINISEENQYVLGNEIWKFINSGRINPTEDSLFNTYTKILNLRII